MSKTCEKDRKGLQTISHSMDDGYILGKMGVMVSPAKTRVGKQTDLVTACEAIFQSPSQTVHFVVSKYPAQWF
jgi:hypothetical protein